MRHVLAGCRPEPLGSYLQGLGVLRLVGEQADADATGWWSDGGFVLDTCLTRDELMSFFLDDYEPSPMVAPWNKGSGFFRGGKSGAAEERLASVEQSTSERLSEMRKAIAVGRSIVDTYPDEASFKEAKVEIITRARSEMPDSALFCLDAAVALTDEKPVYPHVLGTGFNLGRFDLTSNLLGHLDEVIGFDGTAHANSEIWIEDALFGAEQVAKVNAATGQFDPGHAGGVNASTLDDGPALVNPWTFILQLEGALLFASAVSRRLGTWRDSVAAMPFTVRSTDAGSGHLSSEESAKGELWLPLWEVPTTAAELRRLFAEARVRWQGSNATTAVDAARAIGSLGVDRGIAAFSRTVIAERLGQSPLAVSAGRVAVRDRPSVSTTADLDPWIGRMRPTSNSPGVIGTSLRSVNEALMTVAHASESRPSEYLALLEAVADIESAIRQNVDLRKDLSPLPLLNSERWVPLLDDGSTEFAVAWAFASMTERAEDPRRGEKNQRAFSTVWRPSMRSYLRGISDGKWPSWAEGPSVGGEVRRSATDALARVHVAHATNPRGVEGFAGAITTMSETQWLPRPVVEAFAAGALDDRVIGRFVRVLTLCDSRRYALSEREAVPSAVVPAWRLLAPVFQGAAVGGRLEGLMPDRGWPASLARGAVEPVLRAALVRIRARVSEPRTVDPRVLARNVDPAHLNAALLLAVSPRTLNGLLDSFTDNQEEELQ